MLEGGKMNERQSTATSEFTTRCTKCSLTVTIKLGTKVANKTYFPAFIIPHEEKLAFRKTKNYVKNTKNYSSKLVISN